MSKVLEKLRNDLDGKVTPPAGTRAKDKPRPALGDGMHRDTLLQSMAITAQVCVKAAARITGAALEAKAVDQAGAEDFASSVARRLMDDANDFINARMTGKTAKMRKTKKEPKP